MERSLVIDGICKYDTFSPFIISLRDCPKSLLSCSIPNLHFDFLSINKNSFTFKIDTLITKFLPIVVMWDITKVLAVNLSKIFVFPTPEFPIISNLARISCWDIVKVSFFLGERIFIDLIFSFFYHKAFVIILI